MKTFNVYLYFPASELELRVEAESIQDAIQKVELNGNRLLAKDVVWNDSTGLPVRVLGVLESTGLE